MASQVSRIAAERSGASRRNGDAHGIGRFGADFRRRQISVGRIQVLIPVDEQGNSSRRVW